MRLVFLFGPAAAGKLTVAKLISAQTGYALFHNHLVLDALTALFPFGSEPLIRLREQIWLTLFEEACIADRSLVFTFTPEPTVTKDFPEQVRRVVESSGSRIHFVELTVSGAEQERRIENEDRAEFNKLRSLPYLLQIRREEANWQGSMPVPDLTLSTEELSATESARSIIERFGLLEREP